VTDGVLVEAQASLEGERMTIIMDAGGVYRIKVGGHLDENLSERLGGMIILVTRREGGSPMAVLQGRLPDQAALAGVLEALYELHLPLVSVELIQE